MPSMPNKVFNTHSRPSTNPKASYTHLKPSTTNQSPSHPYQALHIHPCPPYYSLALYTHPRSSTQVPGSPHPAQNLIPIPDLPYHHRPSRPPPHPSPPISFQQNVLRAHLAAAYMKSSLDPDPPNIDPETCGWHSPDGYNFFLPVVTPEGTVMAPPALIKQVKCGCKAQTPCSTNRCSCKQNSLSCTFLCNCGENCNNQPAVD